MDVALCISRGYNGFYFGDKFIAKELVSLILTHVDYQSIPNCRLVCKQWNEIIGDPLFWKYKTKLENRKWPNVPRDESIPWTFYACVYFYQPFDRNLIQNPNGEAKLENWKVLSNDGDEFAIEQPPMGCDSVPKEAEDDSYLVKNSCFATSYRLCSKEQIVELSTLGIHPEVIRKYKPKITLRDWYAGRFDCGCVYECNFSLLDKTRAVIADYTFKKSMKPMEGCKWQKVEHCFKEYSENVKFIKFYHGGLDSSYWAGHYGPKMTGSSAIITFS